jgi:NOL1/NOP2/fmu family ribosome biogenesis protein
LAPGGYLIYSTCTFNRAENEDNVAAFVADLPDARLCEIPISDDWHLTRRDGVVHFLPGDIRGEGLTVALIEKSPDAPLKRLQSKRQRSSAPRSKAKVPESLSALICRDDFALRIDGDRVYAVADRWATQLSAIDSALSLPWGVGIEVATIKGKDAIPAHALALNSLLRLDAVATVDVDYPTAIAYLRREAVTLPDDTPRGFVLLTFESYPLGFVKNIGSRANNLYPQAWRILSTYPPQSNPSILSNL